MNLFSWFKSDQSKTLIKLAVAILKVVGVQVADKVMQIAKEEVAYAEATGKPGEAKYEIALSGIKGRLPELKNFAANLAIELAVAALKSRK